MTAYDDLRDALASDPKRWVVTGAAGFIGSAIAETLLALDQHVVGLDNFATGHQRNVDDVRARVGPDRSARFEMIEGDICDAGVCARACEGADYVSHQAALGSVPRSIDDPLASHRANVDGFLQLMIAARDAGAKRVVYASSSSVYGDHPALPKVEENIGRQLSPYAVTKRIDELYAGVVQDCYGLETVGLRYFNVYGRRQDPDGPYAAVIPRWIQLLVDREQCAIFGDGEHSRDFCYVDNAVQANLLAATVEAGDATNRVYNVGLGDRTTLNELYTMIRDLVARAHPAIADTEPRYEPPRPGDVVHSQADISALRDKLGYEPSHRISQGMAETVAWFVENEH